MRPTSGRCSCRCRYSRNDCSVSIAIAQRSGLHLAGLEAEAVGLESRTRGRPSRRPRTRGCACRELAGEQPKGRGYGRLADAALPRDEEELAIEEVDDHRARSGPPGVPLPTDGASAAEPDLAVVVRGGRSRCRRSARTGCRCRGPRRSVSQSTASSSASAAATCDFRLSRSVSSPISMLISRGAWVTPIRMSTAGHSIGGAIGRLDRARRATGAGWPGPASGDPAQIIPFSASRVRERLADVTDHDDEEHEEDPVVHDHFRARPPRQRERLEPAHDRTGRQRHCECAGHERRVQLLACVELRAPPSASDHFNHFQSSSSRRPRRRPSARKRWLSKPSSTGIGSISPQYTWIVLIVFDARRSPTAGRSRGTTR